MIIAIQMPQTMYFILYELDDHSHPNASNYVLYLVKLYKFLKDGYFDFTELIGKFTPILVICDFYMI